MADSNDNENVDTMADQTAAPSGPAMNSTNQLTKEKLFMGTFTGENLTSLNDTQKGFILSIRTIQESDLTGDDLRQTIADMFSPAVLFSDDLMTLPAAHGQLRNFLEGRGVALRQHRSRRIILTLAQNLYDDQEDEQAAMTFAKSIIDSGRNQRKGDTSNRAVPSSVAASTSDDRLAHNIAMRLRDNDRKFSGAINECWMEFVDEYQQIARDYSLNQLQKLQFLHNLLSGDAKRFYLDRVDGIASGFSQAVEMVENEYNSPVRQNKVKNYLSTVRVSRFVSNGMEESEALMKVYREITKMARQAPPSHRGEAHRIEFLHKAVVGYEWAEEPIIRIATHGLSFQQFYAELEAKLQAKKEGEVARLKDSIVNAKLNNPESDAYGINYAGQRFLGKHPATVNHRGRQPLHVGKVPNVQFDQSSQFGCFNCGDPSHILKNCPKPVNLKRAVKNRLEYFAKKNGKSPRNTHLVLAHLCTQLDDEVSTLISEITDEGEQSDADIFQNILDSDEVSIQFMNENKTEVIGPKHESSQESTAPIVSQHPFQKTTLQAHPGKDVPEKDVSEVIHTVAETRNVAEVTIFDDDRDEILINFGVTQNAFHGACVDTGAQRSVIGKMQALAYCEYNGQPFRPKRDSNSVVYKFGEQRVARLGSIPIRFPVKDAHFVEIDVGIVDLDIPLLIGLEVMILFKVVIDIPGFRFVSNKGNWEVPLVLKRGHLYIEWTNSILYTESELRKMHHHFFHPKSERLYGVLKRADSEKCNVDDLQKLQEIEKECDVCQRLSAAPYRFRVSLPNEDVVFNRIIRMDLMDILGNTILHIVDRETKFNAAAFPPAQTIDALWSTYMKIWPLIYVGHPQHMHCDQGPQFQSRRWEGLCHISGIELTLSGIEEHNSLAEGERYHKYLRNIYSKMRSDYPTIGKEYALQLAIKAVNDTAGPDGLVPTLLVFGTLPRLPVPLTSDLRSQKERMEAIDAARKDFAKIIAKRRIDSARKQNVPAAASKVSDTAIGQEVLVYRDPPIGKWIGPFLVRDLFGKHVFVDFNGKLSKFSITRIKPYVRERPAEGNMPFEDDSIDPNFDPLNALDNVMKDIRLDVGTQKLPQDEPLHPDEFFAGSFDINIHLTEVIPYNSSSNDSDFFDEAKYREINGLKTRRTFQVMKESDLSEGANVLSGRFVNAIKNKGTENEVANSRYVAQGHTDKMKDILVHDVSPLRQKSIKMILSYASIKEFRVFSHDVKQAYLQSEDELSREIYLRPKPKDFKFFDLNEGQVLRLRKPLYGNGDSGDYWGVTFDRHVKEDLRMQPTHGDPSLYFMVPPGNDSAKDCAEGLLGNYVDDSLLAGNESFQELALKTLQKFDSRERIWDNFDSFGCTITSIDDGLFSLTQSVYISTLQPFPEDGTFEQFRSARSALLWACQARPDVACAAHRVAQATKEVGFEVHPDYIKLFNSAITRLKKEPIALFYHKLDQSTLHILVYVDASFGSNMDLSSQLGYIVQLCDATNRSHILDFASRKCKRVTRSILGGEVYAFTEGFDCAFMIRHDLESMYQRHIPLQMRTDSKQLFDVIVKASSSTTERRLMIDIAAARESFKRNEVSNIGLVRSEHNIADGLTKPVFCKALDDLLRTGYDHSPVEQWIIKTEEL